MILAVTAGGRAIAGSPAPAKDFEAEFTVTGTFTLYDYESIDYYSEGGSECWGTGGYSDISTGAQVRVSDGAGEVIAVGELQPSGYDFGSCEFTFAVTRVPAGERFYEIEVSHRAD